MLDGTHILKIVAVDTSTQTTQVEYRITTDNNPAPYVEILSPQNNSYVSGVVKINIKAEDNTDVVPNGLYILKTNKNKIFFVLVAR